ncbi:hypothetical protein HNQ51_001546 [Inhella inkyongensis]|uniref:DUF2782 domain-containing protein n=1 Tax=Inhella inkyongensis TaxID=392593 RepID=A0A840S3V7_9BURK|nr:hypothetical protein [Inhella inkyongensis]MBB5204232.1 hypothetical protein [Inhella inkyongensis]
MTLFLRCAALLLAAQPVLAAPSNDTAPPPPRLPELAASAAVPAVAPDAASSSAAFAPELKRRRLAPSDSAKVRISEDDLVRVEEHLNIRGQVVRIVVYPKDGSRPYEMDPPRLDGEKAEGGARRWRIGSF